MCYWRYKRPYGLRSSIPFVLFVGPFVSAHVGPLNMHFGGVLTCTIVLYINGYAYVYVLANLKIKLSQSDPCVNNNNNNLKYTFFTNCRPGLEQNFCQIFFSNLVIYAS